MLRIFLIYIISIVFLVGLVGVVLLKLSQDAYAIKTVSCPNMPSLWEHTYGAGKSRWTHTQTYSRLTELSPSPSTCAVFEGVLRSNPDQGEGDGDLHISLTPDGTRPNDNFDLLNSNNYKNGQPVMVAEVICWGTPNYIKYDKYQGHFCDGVNPHGHIPNLKQHDHVRITGKWVKDVGYPTATHAEWNELHPVQSIQILK